MLSGAAMALTLRPSDRVANFDCVGLGCPVTDRLSGAQPAHIRDRAPQFRDTRMWLVPNSGTRWLESPRLPVNRHGLLRMRSGGRRPSLVDWCGKLNQIFPLVSRTEHFQLKGVPWSEEPRNGNEHVFRDAPVAVMAEAG